MTPESRTEQRLFARGMARRPLIGEKASTL
jgi:hypothetical protein